MPISLKPTGFKSKSKHVCAIRVHSQDLLDVEMSAPGGTTVLGMLQQIAQQIVDYELPSEPPPEYVELIFVRQPDLRGADLQNVPFQQ